jgi:hypothetical protein
MQKTITMPTVRRCPANMRWPGGCNVAVVFNVAYEVWSEGNVSAVGPMGNPLLLVVMGPALVSDD